MERMHVPPARDESGIGIGGRGSKKGAVDVFAGDREMCDWGRLFASGVNGRSPIVRATPARP